MATLTHSTIENTPAMASDWLTAYENYVTQAEFNRVGWAATAIAVQGCILSPTLLLIMAHYGGGDWQFLTSMLCFLLVLVPILAAMPVKYIFPTFIISLVIHLLVIMIDFL